MGNIPWSVRNPTKYCHLLTLQSRYREIRNWMNSPTAYNACPQNNRLWWGARKKRMTTAKLKSCSFVVIISLLLAIIWWLNGNYMMILVMSIFIISDNTTWTGLSCVYHTKFKDLTELYQKWWSDAYLPLTARRRRVSLYKSRTVKKNYTKFED